ncbi:hypothetical protein KAFR_0G02620 [Kazachstania africana CBS 2517]|uniref:sphingosine kinase n=1 Tax=Kazachstania africana (strain ATCC 22294 / BCRC 22015 / CBS 2517 / CECT 1963 / NBRC 1671 / NRRL Y-8276) TaxID=1071382 RepID=H2AY44_KAZAF|nr:hypothetical protein KAFR_0G02620 [Kazachstania africana CBS 2517]CCF59294.1 hypothetical protein KAFR_0G02620 [Kazachstania africana CBS 2517]
MQLLDSDSSITNNNNYSRGILTDDGILIKSQLSNPFEDDPESMNVRTLVDDTVGSYFCFNTCCFDDSTNDPSRSSLLPINTIIPFHNIINARYLNTASIESDDDDDDDDDPNDQLMNTVSQVYSSTNSLSSGIQKNNYTASDENQNGKKTKTSSSQEQANTIIDISTISLSNSNDKIIEITFISSHNNNLIPKKINVLIDYLPSTSTNIVEQILLKSYPNLGKDRNKSLLIIINPHGGKGKALKLFQEHVEPILKLTFFKFEVKLTEYHRHAMQIARKLDLDKFDTIVCASGDGIPYEVINGLYQRTDRSNAFNKLCVTQLPCGSGNAMSISCHGTGNPSHATLSLLKSQETRIDIMSCSQQKENDCTTNLSFLSQTCGCIAESDINTEFIRWMGPIRFDLGVAYNVFQSKKFPCDIYVKYAVKDKEHLKDFYINNLQDSQGNKKNIKSNVITENDFALKYPLDCPIPHDWEKLDSNVTENLSIFYIGKMPYISNNVNFFPAALPNDGTMDLVVTNTTTPVSRMTSILLSLDKGTHLSQTEVLYSKIVAYKIVPKSPNNKNVFSIDGERFNYEPLQVEIIPGLVKTLLKDGRFKDSNFESM